MKFIECVCHNVLAVLFYVFLMGLLVLGLGLVYRFGVQIWSGPWHF